MRERTDALALEADVLVIACGARSPDVAAARDVEFPSGRSSVSSPTSGPCAAWRAICR